MDNMNSIMETVSNLAIEYGTNILLAIITLIIGLWIIKRILKVLDSVMQKNNVEVTLQKFLLSLLGISLKVILLISIASTLGVETTSFMAILGAAGLAVGLALQGSLSNFAGGALILIFKPFKVGDFIKAQGYAGVVKEIQIFNTILTTPDNQRVIIPNGPISNGAITNVSAEDQRRVDMVFGIGYGDDIKTAKEILKNMLEKDDRVLKEPNYQIIVSTLNESSVDITVRAWCEKANYWGIYFDMHENVKYEFDANNISIPFPQRDIHVFNHNA